MMGNPDPMATLSRWQADLSAYALHEDPEARVRLLAQLAQTPVPGDAALQVHVACVHAGLRAALAQRVPTVVALVGEDFFALLAREYARTHPPTAPALSCWGEELPSFLAAREDCAALPWLADVATFDLALDRVAWADPADPDDPGRTRVLSLHHAVDHLREAVAAALEGDDSALARVDLTPAPRHFLLWCSEEAMVRCRAIDEPTARALEAGRSLTDLP